METVIPPKYLCMVNYPGFFKDDEKMLKSLGGLNEVGRTIADPQLRMGVALDVGNKFSKPVYGDRKTVDNSLLLKVRIRRKKKKPTEKPEVASCEVVGVTTILFEFCNIADFQYLPVVNSQSKILDIQNVVMNYDESNPIQPISDVFTQAMPVLASPLLFSRFDRPVGFHFRPNPNEYSSISGKRNEPTEDDINTNSSKGSSSPKKECVGDTTRKRRLNGTQYMRFRDPEVPSEICPTLLDQRMQARTEILSKELEKLFDQKPCWFTKALCYEFRDNKMYQRILLKGCVQRHAYLCYTGPWSRQWIKLGYDPRKDVESKLMQTLDYRLPKRFTGSIVDFNMLNSNKQKKKPVFGKMPFGVTTSSDDRIESQKKEITKADFEIFADQLPPCYNIFVQLQDIHLESVQRIVHSNDGLESEVLEVDGWLRPGTLNKIRAQIELVHSDLPKYKELDEASNKSVLMPP